MFVRTTAPSLKEKSDGDDTVRHKSSKLKKHNKKSRVERQLQKARGVRTHWKCMHCPSARDRYSPPAKLGKKL